MSYDVSIGAESFNYTSNVGKLFYDRIPEQDSRGGLHELHGKTGKQAVEIIGSAFARIHDTRVRSWAGEKVGDPEFCAEYDAPNGWGSTVGGLIFLAQIMAACAANPRKRVHLSA